jgi:hypothetical protein
MSDALRLLNVEPSGKPEMVDGSAAQQGGRG